MKTKQLLIGGLILTVAGGLLFGGCRHHRGHFCGDKLPDKVLKRMDKKVAKLDLNDAQQAKYQKIRGEVKKDLLDMQQRHREAGKVINSELAKETPDMEAIVKVAKDTHSKRPQVFDKYADLLLDFYNTLDDEQKEEVLDKFRDHAERFNCE